MQNALVVKIFGTLVIVGSVVFAYVIMAIMQPATNQMAGIAHAAGVASGNAVAGAYTAATGAYPFWQWVIPAITGVIAEVLLLKNPETVSRLGKGG